MEFHEFLLPSEVREPAFPIQAVGVFRYQNPPPEILKIRMGNNAFHEPLAESASPKLSQDENITQVSNRGAIRDHPREANLRRSVKNAEADGVAD